MSKKVIQMGFDIVMDENTPMEEQKIRGSQILTTKLWRFTNIHNELLKVLAALRGEAREPSYIYDVNG
jgi:hypothetical protein